MFFPQHGYVMVKTSRSFFYALSGKCSLNVKTNNKPAAPFYLPLLRIYLEGDVGGREKRVF